jgi:hypothetical protein
VIVIAASLVAIVVAPLVRPERPQAGRDAERLAELEARKEAKYREIRDAQNDLSAGKLSPEDHAALDRGLRREAVEILEEIDRAGGPAEGGTAVGG